MQVLLHVESKTYNTQMNLESRLTENKLLIILLPTMVAQELQCTYLNFLSLLISIVFFQWNVDILPFKVPSDSLPTLYFLVICFIHIYYGLNCIPQKFMGEILTPEL